MHEPPSLNRECPTQILWRERQPDRRSAQVCNRFSVSFFASLLCHDEFCL
jgi:hypothetical protein